MIMTTANNNVNGVWKWLVDSAAMKFARETQSELRKVTWPTREEAMRLTAVVVVLSLTASIVLFSADSLFAWSLLNLQTLVSPK
jgi:preprotein translocase subunit SecE